MPSTIFEQRAYKFAEELSDDVTTNKIKFYLRRSGLPGPIITFVGGEGRGKSRLLSQAAMVVPPPSARVGFAGTVTWKKIVGDMAVADSIFLSADYAVVGDTLLCDSPAFSPGKKDRLVPSLLSQTDFAVMAVQINQPSGADEVAFVHKYLINIPSVLVLTKCDQADEDDFGEGLEAVLDVYGDFPWAAVLLSDLDGGMMEREGNTRSLTTFGQWWKAQGQARAEEARRAHLERLGHGWRQHARTTLETKEIEFAPLLKSVREARSVSSATASAYRLQDELMDGLKALPEKALYHYRRRVPDLQLRVSQKTDRYIDGIRAGSGIDSAAIGVELSKIYTAWDQEARTLVREEMKSTVERLHAMATDYERQVRAATKSEATDDMKNKAQQREVAVGERLRDEENVELQGEFELTVSDKIRSAAMPAASALGTGLLLFNLIGTTALLGPFAPFLAVISGGMMGIGSGGYNAEANRRKLVGNMKEAIQRQSREQEHTLQQRFSSEWTDFSYGVRESVAASKRRLDVLAMGQPRNQDAQLASEDAALTQNMRKIETLVRDLRWLEEHERGGKLVGETEE